MRCWRAWALLLVFGAACADPATPAAADDADAAGPAGSHDGASSADIGADDPSRPPSPDGADTGGPGACGSLAIVTTPEPPTGKPFAIVVRTADGTPLDAPARVAVGAWSADVRLYRGRGSVTTILQEPGVAVLVAEVTGATACWKGEVSLTVTDRAVGVFGGTLSVDHLSWNSADDVRVTGVVRIAADQTLVIGPGTRVFLAPKARLEVAGRLDARGTADQPILFTRDAAGAWGEVDVVAGANATFAHTFFVAGGGDVSRAFGHSGSQPVLRASSATLALVGGGVLDSPGKAFGTTKARVTLTDIVVSRCDTGGELTDSVSTIADSHFLEMPDADGVFADDDNDGLYVKGVRSEGEASRISRSVFAVGEDDGVDHNGGALIIEDTWIQGFNHEGVAASNGRSVLVRDTVVTGCEQGIEAGYGTPAVTVERCLVYGNDVGLRFGDSYDWGADGSMIVRYTVSIGNGTANVRNYTNSRGGPKPGAVDIACSIVATPGWDGVAGNLAGTPTWDALGCVAAEATDANACDGTAPGPRVCP